MSLIHAGFGIPILLTYLDELLNFRSSIVGESELLEFPLLNGVVHGLCCILKGRLAIGYMQKHCLHRGSLEGIKRLPNAQSDLRRLMVPGMAAVDLRMDDEPGGSPNLAEAYLRSTRSVWRVVTGRVDMGIATVVECIHKALDIFDTVEVCNPGVLGAIADL